MSKVNEWLQVPELLTSLARQGGAPAGETNRLQLDAYARNAVREVLSEEMKLDQNPAALQGKYGAEALGALRTAGLGEASGRAYVRLEAMLSGRDAAELALDKGADPNQLALTRKEEQYLRLAQQGRFDVTNPQFSDDLYFMPYRGMQLNPETRLAIEQGQHHWAKVAQHWGQVVKGERPAGPAPADWWGVRGAALEHVEVRAQAELTELGSILKSGQVPDTDMGQRLERLTVYRDALGADRFATLAQQALGVEGAKLGDWLSFRDQFVEGKRTYWHKAITEGREAADKWDAEHYQPLREIRNQGLKDAAFRPVVEAIQNEAVAVHGAYAALYEAKTGWWAAKRAGKETASFEQKATAAREQLRQLDPAAEGLWGPAAPPWQLDKQQQNLPQQAPDREIPQVGERPARSAAELKAKFAELGWAAMVPHAELIWQKSQKYGLQAEVVAAKIWQESRGNVKADAGKWAGKGLMQIEFGAHKKEIPGKTDSEKLAWIMKPENNVEFGTKMLKGTLDKWLKKYGPDEGLKRGLQYWNYGAGAAAWVEARSKSPEDWQYWVNKYHDTHKYDPKTGKWYEVESGGNYGTPYHWKYVYTHYTDLMGVEMSAPQTAQPKPEERRYDGSKPAAGTTDKRVWLAVTPPMTNKLGQRSEAAYLDVVDQFAVQHNPRYTPRDTSGDGKRDTFCNIFVWDVTRAMGAEIPHWVKSDGSPAAQGAKGAKEQNANASLRWLANHGEAYGWRKVTAEEAQAWANDGKPAVVAWDSGSGRPGHIAMVIPGEYDAKKGPNIAQAGGKNYNHTTVSVGFGTKLMDEVRYYVHE